MSINTSSLMVYKSLINNPMSAYGIADAIGVGVTTVHRCIRKLLADGYVKSAGKERGCRDGKTYSRHVWATDKQMPIPEPTRRVYLMDDPARLEINREIADSHRPARREYGFGVSSVYRAGI